MGTLVVKCAHCGFEQTVSIISKMGGGNEPVEKFHTQMPVRVLGQAVQRGDRYIIEKRAKIGQSTSFICPKCNKPIAIKPQQPGEQVITCKVCNAKVYITAYDAQEEEERMRQEEERRRMEQERMRQQQEEQKRKRAEELRLQQEQEEQERLRQQQLLQQQQWQKQKEQEQKESQYHYMDIPDPEPEPEPSNETVVSPPKRKLTNGELQWGGGMLSSPTKIRLLDGSTLIGRKDPVKKSDIQFNDPEMSRQSVQIDAEPRNGIMSFTLTVLKDLNPVLVNGCRVPQGMSVLLKSGVKIKMGQTTITFKLV